MKINDIYTEVALLGFENEIDEEATFLPALNRALHSVLREVPTVRSAILAHYPPTPLVSESNLTIHGGEGLSYKTEGAKTFYLEIAGAGRVSFKLFGDNDISIPHSLDFDFPLTSDSANPFGYMVFRCFIVGNGGVIPKKVEVTITAKSMCRVRSIAMYDEATSDSKEDIPAPSKYIAYDLKRVTGYGRMCAQPMLADETLISDYVIEDDKLLIPRDITGDVVITYHPAIPRYTAVNGDVLPISDDLKGALVYLIASCVWLDDNKDRSQYYKTLYNEEIALVARKRHELNITRYESVNNW